MLVLKKNIFQTFGARALFFTKWNRKHSRNICQPWKMFWKIEKNALVTLIQFWKIMIGQNIWLKIWQAALKCFKINYYNKWAKFLYN